MSDPKIESVQRLYLAFGGGDTDGVLDELADDVDWAAEASGTAVPWWGPFRGRGEVPGFFKAIGSSVDVTEFSVLDYALGESHVVATVHWAYTVRATGRTAEMTMQHWWRFAGGRIVSFRGSEDTEQSARAFAGA